MTTGPWKQHVFFRYGTWWSTDEFARTCLWWPRRLVDGASYSLPAGLTKAHLEAVKTVGRNRQRQLAELIR